MKAKTRTNQPVEFENYDIPEGAKVLGDCSFENITDADGHKRFFEIAYTPASIEGLTWGYTKASLNGKELNVVLRGASSTSTSIESDTILCDISIPQWLADKIYTNTAISQDYVMSSFAFIDEAGTLTFKDAYMEKKSGPVLRVKVAQSITTTGNAYFNVEFHLIIE